MLDEDESLDKLIFENFEGNVINKDLMRKAGLSFLPRYVSEFVLGHFLSVNENVDDAISEAKNFVYEKFPEPNEAELIKHKLIEIGEIQLLQRYKATVNLSQIEYTVSIPVLRDKIRIESSLTTNYPAMLTTGLWGLGLIRYNPQDKKFPLDLVSFKPFQLGSFDRKEYFTARANFTLKQWIQLIIYSLGLNPEFLSQIQQLHLITRLIPLASKNINMSEFGPKSTGKTYQYRNHSSYAHVISGSSISPAKFAFDLNTRTPGLISTSDVVVFDEVTSADFGQKKDFEMIGLLKDYMEGGNVARGGREINEDASLVFLGNIEIRGTRPKFEDFVRELPSAFSDPAFIDRIYGFIPGWEIPKIGQTDTALTDKPGLMSNYIGEALHNLRTWDHPTFNWSHVDSDLLNIRNEKAVMNLTAGMLKLLFPGVEPSVEELNLCLNIGTTLRQNVYDQLHHQEPDEFEKHRLIAKLFNNENLI